MRDAGLSPDRAARRIAYMRSSFPLAEVTVYQSMIESMVFDRKDRHVLAAAVRGGAQVLVTFNLGDFPAHAVTPYDITSSAPIPSCSISSTCIQRQWVGFWSHR